MPGIVALKHGIEVNGVQRTELRFRHSLRMGDLAAVQRYARREGIKADASDLLADGDYGALLALFESLCQLPGGTLDQLHPDDLPGVVEAAAPFLGEGGPETGSQP